MKVYTVEEIAAILRVEYKTVLRLIERGLLKVLPGIRHKRVPEEELKRYLDVRGLLAEPVATPAIAFPQSASVQAGRVNKPDGKSK
jgi:excisionase family DNA binding protein